jgi:hypothetical protein
MGLRESLQVLNIVSDWHIFCQSPHSHSLHAQLDLSVTFFKEFLKMT